MTVISRPRTGHGALEKKRERRHRYHLHNARYHRPINYGNVSSRGASITRRVSSSADSVAARDLSFLLDCQEQRRIRGLGMVARERTRQSWLLQGRKEDPEKNDVETDRRRKREKSLYLGLSLFLEKNLSRSLFLKREKSLLPFHSIPTEKKISFFRKKNFSTSLSSFL